MSEPRTPLQPAQPAPPMHPPHPAPGLQPGLQPRVGQPAPGIARPAMSPNGAPGMAPRPGIAQQPQQRVAPAAPQQNIPRPGVAPAINPAAAKPHAPEAAIAMDEEIVELEADGSPAAAPASKIKFGAEVHRHHDWKRPHVKGGMGACRVRTFHGKLSDQGLEYIDEAINMWLDANHDIDIKFVTTNVGMFDGKFKDLALIVNVWY